MPVALLLHNAEIFGFLEREFAFKPNAGRGKNKLFHLTPLGKEALQTLNSTLNTKKRSAKLYININEKAFMYYLLERHQ
jgi:hypothetical protein